MPFFAVPTGLELVISVQVLPRHHQASVLPPSAFLEANTLDKEKAKLHHLLLTSAQSLHILLVEACGSVSNMT